MIFPDDLAIDLGSTRARMHCARRGALLDVPSVVALDRLTREPLAVGDAAFERVGRVADHIELVWPVRAGRVADFDTAEVLLRCMLRAARNRLAVTRPRVVMTMPAELTPLEKRALREAALTAGAGEVFLVAAPVAAALGAAAQAQRAAGHVVLDVGAGTTELAILGLSGAVYQRSVPLGGGLLDDALAEHLRSAHDLIVGAHTLERVKCALVPGGHVVEVRGHDRNEGSPRSVEIAAAELRESLAAPIELLVGAIRSLIVEAPPELCAEAASHRVLLAGGGGLVDGFAGRLEKSVFLPVECLADPCQVVVRGCAVCLEDLDALRDLVLERPRPVGELQAALI